MAQKTKYALVLSGGGFKGAFQVGALNYLAQNWDKIDPRGGKMHFDLIAGVSVGSLNGGMIAMDKLAQLNELWEQVAANGVEEIYTSDFIDTQDKGDKLKLKLNFDQLKERFLPGLKPKISLGKFLGMAFSKKKREKYFEELIASIGEDLKTNLPGFRSIADNQPLADKLKTLFKIKDITDSKYLCGFVSLDTGVYHAVAHDEFDNDEDFVNAVLASTAMPIIWEPVPSIHFGEEEALNSVDGGIMNVSPLGDVIAEINRDREPDTEYFIIVINCANGQNIEGDFSGSNIGQIALRSLNEVAITEIFNNDLREFVRINDIVRQVSEVNPGMQLHNYDMQNGQRSLRPLRAFKALIIQPETGALGETLVGNRNWIDKRMEHGEAKAAIAVRKYLGFDPEEFLQAVA